MTTPAPAPTGALIAEALRSLATDVGVVTSTVQPGGNTLSDSTKQWITDVHRYRLLRLIPAQGAGVAQQAWIDGNTIDTVRIQGAWRTGIAPGTAYVILDMDIAEVMRDVFGGGANISSANRLPVDTTPGTKTINQILTLANLIAGATSTIANCNSLDLRTGPLSLSLTVVAAYNAAATLGLRVHVRTSPDNVNWDSEDWDMWTAGFTAGAVLRETVDYETDPMYLRVLIENLDAAQAITGIGVIASVGA